ncbi:MAG TPA: hypothetical protein VGD60_04335 [Candidatus Acidoferrales bacterium]
MLTALKCRPSGYGLLVAHGGKIGILWRDWRRIRRGDSGAGAWMRFFVARGAPQNDDGLGDEAGVDELSRFAALDYLAVAARSEYCDGARWRLYRCDSGVGAWMKFFVAKCAPQMV